jgi:hypothetical protein
MFKFEQLILLPGGLMQLNFVDTCADNPNGYFSAVIERNRASGYEWCIRYYDQENEQFDMVPVMFVQAVSRTMRRIKFVF